LAELISRYDVQLKFVLTSPEEVAEIEALLARLPQVPAERVLLMAEGVTPETQRQRQRSLVDVCIDRGWRLTPRMHIDLFGDTRGT
jgi:7-carboxy-7-deazaguanine synthase